MGIDNDLLIKDHVPLIKLGNNFNIIIDISVLRIDLDRLNGCS